MHTEIATFCDKHGLPPAAAEELASLVGRLPFDLSASDMPGGSDGLPSRYTYLGLLGVGGMGEVRRVRDQKLGRSCAYKAIRADQANKPSMVARFVEEAQIAAQLQHPHIPPVYDAGQLADGRPWFTMKEVRGETFGAMIASAHARGLDGPSLHRLCDVLGKVCDAVGYAHGRGVVHRDLKPDNVMVGAFGEVYVLDWGLAKVVGRPDLTMAELEPEVTTDRSEGDAHKTRMGGVMGTAAYMPPEQARGKIHLLDARSDVYALGAILYQVLSGRAPYVGPDGWSVVRQVLAGPPVPPNRVRRVSAELTSTFDLDGRSAPEPSTDPAATDTAFTEGPTTSLPEELLALCLHCMSRNQDERPADGLAVGAALRAWLDGAGRRAKALEVVSRAEATVDEAAALRSRAAELRAAGAALLADVPKWAPENEKAAGWALEDEATRLEGEAEVLTAEREALLQASLTHAPDLPEAHALLVAEAEARHAAAEAARDAVAAAQAEARLRSHVESLPEGHAVRTRVAAYLKGVGALTLETDPPGAEVALFRYELQHRRLVATPVGLLGHTPLRSVPLPMGSYLCVLRHPERAEVRYPVAIGRGEHWDGVPPDGHAPHPVHLPTPDALGPDDCYVPAGWFWSGGDAEVRDSLPRRRLWCDGWVMRQFPVTNRSYLAFLNDLVATGREAEAVLHEPRERAGGGGAGASVYGRDSAGRYVLQADADGDVWGLDWPVCLVDWHGASACAAWEAARTGAGWRLPPELVWEKSARGVDGRFFPWGDGDDPSWACLRDSHRGRALPQVVNSFPTDVSVVGVRGMSGNMRDLCSDVYAPDGAPVAGARVAVGVGEDAAGAPVGAVRVVRGGAWILARSFARIASRDWNEPDFRVGYVGFRLARPL